MKILLVEDEEGLIITLTDRLRSEGFDVTSANDGRPEAAHKTNTPMAVVGLKRIIIFKFDLCRESIAQRSTVTI